MPKAYDNVDLYESEIEERKVTLRSTIEESKWLVDLCSLLALAIAMNTLLFVLIGRAFHGGLTMRLAFGLVVVAVLGWKVWVPAREAVSAVTDTILFRVQAFFGAPYDWQERHIVLRALWKAFNNTIGVFAIWGTGFAFAELIKMSAML